MRAVAAYENWRPVVLLCSRELARAREREQARGYTGVSSIAIFTILRIIHPSSESCRKNERSYALANGINTVVSGCKTQAMRFCHMAALTRIR